MNLRNPRIRELILVRLEGFADQEYQERVWVRGEMPGPNFHDDFDGAVNDLFDGVGEPGTGIADVFVNEAEVAAAADVLSAVDAVIDDVGRFGSVEEARAHPGWPRVVAAAQTALRVMTARR